MLTIKSLGLSKEEITDRVVQRIASMVMETTGLDEDGEQVTMPSTFGEAIRVAVMQRVNQAIEEIAGRHVLPNVASYVEALCLQETNRWGEKTGKPVTFTEYLVARAEQYLTEEVSFEGKTKAEAGSYSWSKSGTRIAYMVNKHLQYSIQAAMEEALKTANSAIVGGIEQAVKIKLGEVLAALKVEAKVGR